MSPEKSASSIVGARRPRKGTSTFPPFVVIACSVIFFWSISSRSIVFAVMPTVAAELGISSTMSGIVVAFLLLGYCLGNWFVGWIPGSRKSRILGGALISVPGLALVSQSTHFLALLLGMLLLGFGVGLYLTLGLEMIVDAGARGSLPVYLAVHEILATLGAFAGPTFLATVLGTIDWRGALLSWCLVGLAATALFFAVRDADDRRPGRHGREPVPVDAAFVYCVAVYAVATVLAMGLTSMLTTIMVRSWGMSQADAASVLGYTRLAGLAGIAVAGLVAHRRGAAEVTIVLQITAAIGAVAMSLDGYGPVFLAGVLVLTAAASGFIALVPAVVSRAYLPAQRERATAAIWGIGGILGMVITPAVFGTLIDAGLPTAPIVFSGAASVLAVFATLRIPLRVRPRSPEHQQ